MDTATGEFRTEEDRRWRRDERLGQRIMIFQGVLVLGAVAGIAWWATGHPVLVPLWLAIVAFQAIGAIYSQMTIRLLRRANREVLRYADELRGQLFR